jgi:hypothetical protein
MNSRKEDAAGVKLEISFDDDYAEEYRTLVQSRRDEVKVVPVEYYRPGGMRRTHLRGHDNIRKRLLVHASAFNLGLLLRTMIGRGTPRGLQGLLSLMSGLTTAVRDALEAAAALWIPSVGSAARRPELPAQGLVTA